MKKKVTLDIICFLLIFLWSYAAFTKLITYGNFQIQLSKHPLLMHYASVIALVVPIIEIIIALLLLLPQKRRTGLYASLFLLILFAIYIAYTLVFYSHAPCSCGGIIESLSWQQHLLLNIGCIILSSIGIRLFPSNVSGNNNSIQNNSIQNTKNVNHAF